MKKLIQAVKANPRQTYIILGVLFLLIIAVSAYKNNGNGLETFTVAPGDFLQQVSVSGKVVPAQSVDLTFPEAGRVGAINVKVGDKVIRGQTLAYLSTGTLFADLRAAEIDLQEITKEQDSIVESAYRELLSEGLAPVPNSSYGVTSPIITGIYQGGEGEYRVSVERVAVAGGDYELRTFGLERTDPIEVLDDEPSPLGTLGLYITFPDSIQNYSETRWTIEIPNRKSSSYLQNYNAYQEALRTRDKMIANAQADIQSIQADLAERTLRAPFTGVVTAIDAELGGIVSTNQPVLSMITADELQIESFVPEINLAFVKVGATAQVTLDTYGPQVIFEATVASIDPAETIRDGVSTYRTTLNFSSLDERIRSGMTANVTITADQRSNVLTIPQGSIIHRNGTTLVKVKEGDKIVERQIITGATSSFGATEVISGLTAGEIVVLFE